MPEVGSKWFYGTGDGVIKIRVRVVETGFVLVEDTEKTTIYNDHPRFWLSIGMFFTPTSWVMRDD